MNLKEEKGFTGIDISISAIIIIIFVSLITSFFYQATITSKRLERNATATNLCIEIIETLKSVDFNNLTKTTMTIDEVNAISGRTIIIPNGYNTNIEIEDYNDENLIKTLKVIVSYKQNTEVKTIKLETLIKNL